MVDIVGMGLCCYDFTCLLPRIPSFEQGMKMTASSEQGGGAAANAVCGASRLGASCAFIGRTGDDYSGHLIREDFKNFAVKIDNVLVQTGHSSHKVVVLVEESTGRRSFIGNRPTVEPLERKHINLDLIGTADILHLDGKVPSALILFVIKKAKELGVTVSLDVTRPQFEIEKVLPYVDIFIPSQNFITEQYTFSSYRKAVRYFFDLGPSQVIITRGKEGCVGLTGEGFFELPAFLVSPVIDTTGCGDAFHGAYLYAFLKQDWDLRLCAEFASAAAALNSQTLGGRKGLPEYGAVLDFLNRRLPDKWGKI